MTAQARKLVHSDIKPDNPPERVAHYLDVPNMPWEKTKFPGIGIKVLYTDDKRHHHGVVQARSRRHCPAPRTHGARADLCDRRLARRSRGKVWAGSVRL